MKKRVASLLLSLVMMLSLLPVNALALTRDTAKDQVHVIVENTTYAEADGAPWYGTPVDTWVNITDDSTMMSCVLDALKEKGYSQTGAESNYITEIKGLAAGDGSQMSGWMGTLNDWFTSEGLGAYTVASGNLKAGDEIRIMYTLDYGADLGSDWSNNDKTLKNVTFSAGTLDKTFDKAMHAYTLTVPENTAALTVTPTAANKNFQVRTYVGTTEYKRTAEIPVQNGTVIKVKCGDPSWPSMNNAPYGDADNVAAETYTFTVAYTQPALEKPSFDMINVQSTVLASGCWVQNNTYQKDTYAYDIALKNATVSLMLAATTKYDTAKYTAVASYQSAGGQTKEVAVNSVKSTTIANAADLPFGQSTVTVTISAISDPTNKTEYVFNVTRPRDETKTIKNAGIVLAPEGRDLLAAQYNGQPEGTMFQLNDDGTFYVKSNKVQTGVAAAQYNYRAFALDGLEKFTLNFTGSSAYSHLRYSTDDGATWSEAVQESGATAPISFPSTTEGNPSVKVMIQVLDDKTYTEKGFDADSAKTYTVWVECIAANSGDAQILTAQTQSGDWYPAFSPKQNSFTIVVPNGTKTMNMTFTASEGATVDGMTPDEHGVYTAELKTTAKTISVTSAAGITNKYSFKLQARSAKDYADSVVDYLVINSQYTNKTYGLNPQSALAGSMVSLGNWGGYITYYFDKPLTDDPHNKYGMDFYAYGNAFAAGGSAAENGQVWVSEDGNIWYALAGSEHYEDDVLWDYQVTYSKTDAGKTAWVDNQGNSNDGSSQSGDWVDPSIYYMNGLAKNDTITLKGIVMNSQGGTIRGDSSTGEKSFAHAVSFGYVDYFGNGTVGADVNPYIENPVNANGFDLKWAVDAQGNAVDVAGMEFHYVKVVTASNIWAGAFNEKSTESAGVLRTTPQEAAVGKTAAPSIKVNGTEVDTTKPLLVFGEFTVSVAAAEGANVYINNQRATEVTFKEIPSHGMIRVIVQEGDKEAYVATFAVSDDPTPVIEEANDIYAAVGENLQQSAEKNTPSVGSIGGEWEILGLARSGKLTDDVAEKYFANVSKTVKDNNGVLDKKKYTEYSRVILALTAAGYDPTNVEGYDLTAPITDYDKTVWQGNNGATYALIALDSHDYQSDNTAIRKQYVDELLGKQLDNGGWNITSGNADPDMTAMVIQALAPYYESNADVKTAVDRALDFLSEKQGADGDFGSCETCAQVVVALSALGIDAASDGRFAKNGYSVLSALNSYYVEDATYGAGFIHDKKSGSYNQMATEQGYYALAAYHRFMNQQNSLYDMNDVVLHKVYVILDGADSVIRAGQSVSIRASGALADFVQLQMDGNTLDTKNYALSEGSTIVTFDTDYLKSLEEGVHTVTFVYTDGEVSTSLTVKPAENPNPADPNAPVNPDSSAKDTDAAGEENVKTGDAGVTLWVMLAVTAVCGMAYIGKKRHEV